MNTETRCLKKAYRESCPTMSFKAWVRDLAFGRSKPSSQLPGDAVFHARNVAAARALIERGEVSE